MMVLAYLDPGTGSLIMQALLAGAAGIAVFWKTAAKRFRRKSAEEAEPVLGETSTPDEPAPSTTD